MPVFSAIVAAVAGHQVLFFAALLLLVLLVIAAMTAILLRARKAPEAAAVPVAAPPPAEPDAVETAEPLPGVTGRDLRRLFRAGLTAYRETLSRNLYLVPWYLRLGVVPGGDGGLLSCADEARPPVAATDRPHGFRWRFYDRAVAIDIDDPRVARSAVLEQLARHRAMLPADGLILTVPLSELDDSRRATALGTELYGQLWELQRTLGFALPVYVVVTGCEGIGGFGDLVEALPEGLRGGILGWSSPYPLEASFTPDLAGEALRAVADGLLAVQLEIFGAAGTGQGSGLVSLTDRIAGTEAALRGLLGTAFKRTAYQETLFFRGLYFVGQTDAEAPAVFGRDLLNRKIFREAGLPKPARALAAARAWRRYAWPGGTAAAAALALMLLWIGVNRADTVSGRLVSILADIPSNLQQLADQRTGAEGGVLPPTYTDAAARFVRGVATLPEGRPFNPLPASWTGGAMDEATKALAVGYRRVALGTVRDVAEERLRRLAQGTQRADSGSELDRLRGFAADLGIAEGMAKAYNEVDLRDPNAPLDDLLEFALGARVANGFSARLRAWSIDLPPGGGAIPAPGPGSQRTIDVSAYRADLTRRFRQLCDAYFRALSMGGLAVARLSVAANELDMLAGGSRRGADAVTSYAEVLAGLEEASRGLSLERGSWIGSEGPVLPPEFDALLAQLEKSELLGPGLRADILELARRRYDEAGAGAKSLDSVIGRLLVQTGSGSARLSPAAEGLRQTLSAWMARRFMRPADPAAARSGGAWDQAALETVPPLTEDYLLFEAKDMPQAPPVLQASLRAAARQQLLRAVEPTLAGVIGADNAAWTDRAGGLPQLRDAARSLRLAFPVLAETMQSFRQIGLASEADAIRDAVARRASAVLGQADRMLQEAQLYQPDLRGMEAWVNGPLLPYALFGQPNPAGLALYLGNARQEVASLARDVAAPLVDILGRPAMGKAAASGLSDKWGRILSELDRYEGEKPNSSLARLEKFITVDSASVDADGCRNLPSADGNPADYFQSRLNDLTQAIAARCRLAVESRGLGAYTEVASVFNGTLSGRFPFAAAPDAEPADPAAIRAFYDAVDAQGDSLTKSFQTDRLGPAGRDARRFVDLMMRARPLLTAVTDDKAGGVTLDPAFRVNRARESGGAEILEWRLGTASASLSNLLPRTPLRWSPGEPLSVTLRWAKDGKRVPAAGAGPSPSSIDGAALTYRFDGPWALFALLRQHAAPVRDRAAAGESATLLFEASTKPSADIPADESGKGAPAKPLTVLPAPVPAGASPDTRVFLGLAVKRAVVADGKPAREETVPLPELPIVAPLLSAGPLRPGLAAYQGYPAAAVAPIDRAMLGLGAPPPGQPFLRPAAQRLD